MQVSVAEARNNLSGWLKKVQDKPVVITRRGQPVGVLVSYVEYEDLRRIRAYLKMIRLAQSLSQSGVTATELFQWSRSELEARS
jgi:prevent-host-death family protein